MFNPIKSNMFSVGYTKILLWSFFTLWILSNQSTECANVSCGLPPPVSNSVAPYSSINFGSTVTYVCNKGYILYGTSQRTCRANGKWDAESPDCRRTCGFSPMDFRRRIVGGVQSRRGIWPWQIALYIIGNEGVPVFQCGGALVSRQWVLTAAHCVPHGNASSYLIKAGKHNLTRNETLQQEIEPQKIFVHHEYRFNDDFDIALVKLKTEFKLNSFVRTICLPIKEEGDLAIPMTNGVVSGWGITRALRYKEDYSPHEISEVLRHAVFTIQSNQLCSITYNSTVQFCAGDGKGKKDACVGDSGGAFVREIRRGTNVHWVAVGIVSWGEGCAQKDKYGYYTRVYPFIDWIEKTMEDRPAHGRYSKWSHWDSCSQSCAGGIQRRYRVCNHPKPENGDCNGLGRATESRRCNTQSCPGLFVKCTNTEMLVTLDIRLHTSISLDDVTLNDANCKLRNYGDANATHLWMRAPLDTCMTNHSTVGDTITYANSILIETSASSDAANSSRKFQAEFPFKCSYSRSAIVSVASFSPRCT